MDLGCGAATHQPLYWHEATLPHLTPQPSPHLFHGDSLQPVPASSPRKPPKYAFTSFFQTGETHYLIYSVDPQAVPPGAGQRVAEVGMKGSGAGG